MSKEEVTAIIAKVAKQNDCILHKGVTDKREWYTCHYLEESGMEIAFLLIRDRT